MEDEIFPQERRPRRRRRTQLDIFKEAYLPYLILIAAAVLIVIFIIGAVVRNTQTTASDPGTAQAPVPQHME